MKKILLLAAIALSFSLPAMAAESAKTTATGKDKPVVKMPRVQDPIKILPIKPPVKDKPVVKMPRVQDPIKILPIKPPVKEPIKDPIKKPPVKGPGKLVPVGAASSSK